LYILTYLSYCEESLVVVALLEVFKISLEVSEVLLELAEVSEVLLELAELPGAVLEVPRRLLELAVVVVTVPADAGRLPEPMVVVELVLLELISTDVNAGE
jgi:hypothetical protein